MPQEAVKIDATVEMIPTFFDTYDSVLIVGTDGDGTADAGELVEINSIYDAEEYFGSNTDLTNNLKNALNEGCDSLYAYNLIEKEEVETFDTEGDDFFDLEHTPSFISNSGITVEFDGSDVSDSVFATYEELEGTETISSNESYLNSEQKKLLFGTALGSEEDLVVTYKYIDWDDLEEKVTSIYNLGVVAVTGLHRNEEYTTETPTNEEEDVSNRIEVYQYGDKVEFLDFATKNRSIFPLPIYAESLEFATSHTVDIDELISKNAFVVAHKYAEDDVSGSIAGALSTIEPNDKIMWKRIKTVETRQYMFSKIETSNYEDEQINTIIYKDGLMLFSNGFSTTTEEGFRWIDVTRSKFYIVDSIHSKLENTLKFKNVPYNSKGISMIRSSIDKSLRDLVNEDVIQEQYYDEFGDLRQGYRIIMPDIRNISTEDRDNRLLRNINIVAKLPGHIQTIEISMNLLI